MNIILPVAGKGLRMQPHTLHRPKALIHVAGDAVLGHVIDDLRRSVDADRWVFIVGHLGELVEAWVRARYDFDARFVVQTELSGQAPAIALAREHLHGPVLVVFAADTVFDIDLAGLAELPADIDGVVHLMRVDDPRRFGVAVCRADGTVERFIEKPATFVSDQAVVGVYYFRDGRRLLAAIDRLVAERAPVGGEHFLADALQIMVDDGVRLLARPVRAWVDCGTVPATLAAQRWLFERRWGGEVEGKAVETTSGPDPSDASARYSTSRIIPPVSIAPDAIVERSVVGPYVHVGPGCRVVDSVVGSYVSLEEGVTVERAEVEDAIVERGAEVRSAVVRERMIAAEGWTFGSI